VKKEHKIVDRLLDEKYKIKGKKKNEKRKDKNKSDGIRDLHNLFSGYGRS
jgi:hypothetical protein